MKGLSIIKIKKKGESVKYAVCQNGGYHWVWTEVYPTYNEAMINLKGRLIKEEEEEMDRSNTIIEEVYNSSI